MLMFGQTPVPFTVCWSDEAPMRLANDEACENRLAVCNLDAPGKGKPIFGKPHMQRQREAVVWGLCDLCGRHLKGRSKVSLSHASVRRGANGLCVMQVEPLLHKDCAAKCLEFCPSLKSDIKTSGLYVRLVTQYQVQMALLTSDATEEFTGTRHSGAVGHAKIELLKWVNKSAEWLGKGA